MVTVATKLDVPIKLLFPRPDGCVYPVGAAEGSETMKEYLVCKAKKATMAMLGLGDIVVPGMVVALALRFDLYLHYLKLQKKTKQLQQQEKGVDDGRSEPEKEKEKVPFQTATGAWGERFWTSIPTTGNLTTQVESAPTTQSPLVEALRARSFPKPYFYATVIGYLGGLVATVMVMQVWGHAQPALLYLVPGVLGMFWGTAVVKGELGVLWRYTEAEEEEGKEEEQKKKKEGVEEGTRTKRSGGVDDNTLESEEELARRQIKNDTEKPAAEEEWDGEKRGEQANGEVGRTTETDKTRRRSSRHAGSGKKKTREQSNGKGHKHSEMSD